MIRFQIFKDCCVLMRQEMRHLRILDVRAADSRLYVICLLLSTASVLWAGLPHHGYFTFIIEQRPPPWGRGKSR
jgi:hypothetical protein